MDKITLSVIADLLINMAAAWFGLVFIAPSFSKKKSFREKLIISTGNIFAGIVSLISADYLRRLI